MRTAPVSHRPAFTLLEILVALVMLGVGILGVSASATLVSRMIGDGSRLSLAATIATARLERLRAMPCASATSGIAVSRGIEERWSVTTMGAASPAALDVHISLTYPVRTGHRTTRRTHLFRGAVHCTTP